MYTFFPFGFAKTALSEHGWGIIEKSNAKKQKIKAGKEKIVVKSAPPLVVQQGIHHLLPWCCGAVPALIDDMLVKAARRRKISWMVQGQINWIPPPSGVERTVLSML